MSRAITGHDASARRTGRRSAESGASRAAIRPGAGRGRGGGRAGPIGPIAPAPAPAPAGIALAAALAAALGAGCTIRVPAAEDRGVPTTWAEATEATETTMPIDWPDRGPLTPEELAGPEDGVVLNRHPWVDRAPSPWLATLREEPIRVRWTRPAGRGVVRAIESAGPDRSATGGDPPPAETGEIPSDVADPESVVRLVFVSEWTRETEASLEAFPDPAGRAEDWGPPERPLDRHWGVRMRYRPASPEAEPRGVMVHLHGLGGHGLERSVQAPLCEAGWGVLECVYPLANWSRITVETTSDASIHAAAQGLAGIIDQRFGELAMGAEAALAALAAEGDPAAAAGPVVVAAFSAGGNAAPAVIARLGARVRAAAIVVAGADLMRITVASGLGDTGLDAERDGRRIDRRSIRDAVRQELSGRYLDRVQLDGWVLGPRLEPVPTLLVLGRFDAVVPTATGRLLRARLGEPETWWVLGGHVGTYVSLTWNGGRIGRWLRRHGEADGD